jgi:hypothetical protein
MVEVDFFDWRPLLDDEDTGVIFVQPSPHLEDEVQCSVSRISLKVPRQSRTSSNARSPTFSNHSHLADILHADSKMPLTKTQNMALKRLQENKPFS